MQRLGMWASVYDCAIVLIGHLNKKEGTKGLYRSLGSIDVVAAARSVLQVERDQKDTDIRIVRQINQRKTTMIGHSTGRRITMKPLFPEKFLMQPIICGHPAIIQRKTDPCPC